MEIKFNFTKSEIAKIVIFKIVVIGVIFLMSYLGADFR
jgi:hypothetical protein